MDPNIIIDHFGGLDKTAQALHVTKQAVSNWRRRKTLPSLRVYQIANMLNNEEKMGELKRTLKSMMLTPSVLGRRPKLTREQLAEVHQVTGSGKVAKYGSVQLLAAKFGCSVKVITRARLQGYKLYRREDKTKTALCGS